MRSFFSIIDSIKPTDKVILFGTGEYATRLYSYLDLIGKGNSVALFLVSKKELRRNSFFGKRVNTVDGLISKTRYRAIILSVSEKYKSEVKQSLESLGVELWDMPRQAYEAIPQLIETTCLKLPIQRNKIFIDCFEGRGYKCNCKYIAEYLLKKSNQVHIVWDIEEDKDGKGVPNELPSAIKKVVKYSGVYYRELYTSGVLVCNNDTFPSLNKRPEQYIINTWHGTGGVFKKSKAACEDTGLAEREKIRSHYNRANLFISNSSASTEMYRNSFLYDGEILETGYPRNDLLFCKDMEAKRNEIKARLGLPLSVKIIMYAPTYRKKLGDSFDSYDVDMGAIIGALEERFDSDFKCIYRFHQDLFLYLDNMRQIITGYDMSFYQDVMELLLISDVLITDYSSIMWDYSLMRRPVFLYHKDVSNYKSLDRGFYISPNEWPYPKATSIAGLCGEIRGFNEEDYFRKLDHFFNIDKSFDDGKASERVGKRIIDVIDNPEKYVKA